VFVTTAFFVKETFVRNDKKVLSFMEAWNFIPEKNLTVVMLITIFALTLALYSVEPVITVYIARLAQNTNHIALLAGLTFSASGLASIIAAPRLGKLSDKIGPQKVMLGALLVAGIIFIPQAFVKNPWQLMALRFLLGLASAGLMPSVHTLIKRITPDFITGRVFGLTMSAGYLGVFAGSILGGQVAAYWGLRYVFLITSALLFINAALVYFKVYKKLNLKDQNLIIKDKTLIKILSKNKETQSVTN